MEPIIIKSGQGDFRVDFFPNIPSLIERTNSFFPMLTVIDRRVAELYSSNLDAIIEKTPHLLLDATEEEKTWTGVEKVLEFLQNNHANRKSKLLAIGGGIIQEIVAFTAHIYYRGIKWDFIPTTLLAMSDSCIGAKCNINFRTYKNQIGAYHSPDHVFLCPDFVQTLSDQDIRSGYGEIFKLMLIGSQELVDKFISKIEQGTVHLEELDYFIALSLRIKQKYIEEDEYEHDVRLILNYGHTFGHALESLTNYEIPHGCAVAWGIDLANYISKETGYLSNEDFDAIHQIILNHFNFKLSKKVEANLLIEASRRDKKVSENKINLILLGKPGDLKIVPTPFDDRLTCWISDYFEKYQVVYWD